MSVLEEQQHQVSDALRKMLKAAIGAYLDGDHSEPQQLYFSRILEAGEAIRKVLGISNPKVLTDEEEAELRQIPRDADIEQTIAQWAESESVRGIFQGSSIRRFRLNELGDQIKSDDVLLEGTITLLVDVSIERVHQVMKEESSQPRIVPGNGYLVTLAFPSHSTLQTSSHIFADGERQLLCDLRYEGEDGSAMNMDEIVKALSLSIDKPVWRIRKAP